MVRHGIGSGPQRPRRGARPGRAGLGRPGRSVPTPKSAGCGTGVGDLVRLGVLFPLRGFPDDMHSQKNVGKVEKGKYDARFSPDAKAWRREKNGKTRKGRDAYP